MCVACVQWVIAMTHGDALADTEVAITALHRGSANVLPMVERSKGLGIVACATLSSVPKFEYLRSLKAIAEIDQLPVPGIKVKFKVQASVRNDQ